MRKNYIYRSVVLLFASVLLFSSCEKELDKYYELPSWLRGNAWDILEEEGNYSIFLKGLEISGLEAIVQGTGIVTVIAPDDDAFRKYLNDYYGVQSIESLNDTLVKQIIDYHVIYYSYSQEMFANYNPNGMGSVNSSAREGTYYKYRTRSAATPNYEYEYFSAVSENGVFYKDSTRRLVYHLERLMPVFSGYLFRTKQIEAKSNYEYFYPNSTWESSALDNLQFSNASVDEYQIATDNGYIYKVDKVVHPLNTIYTELADSGEKYSSFLSLYDRFATYTTDATINANYGDNYSDSLSLKSYLGDLPNIALEWSTTDNTNFSQIASGATTIFAPTNQALTTFFNEFWRDGGYQSLSEINYTPLKYVLDNHYASGLIFPEEITTGKVTSVYNDLIQFNVDDTDLRQICVNGAVYGINEVIKPKIFNTVLQPMFKYVRFNSFLLMADQSYGFITTLSGTTVDFDLFYFSDSKLLDGATLYQGAYAFGYQNLNPYKYGYESVTLEGSDGFAPISSSITTRILDNHILVEQIASYRNSRIYRTLNTFEYVVIDETFDSDGEGDPVIFSTDGFNRYMNDLIYNPDNANLTTYSQFPETYSNGRAFELHGQGAILFPASQSWRGSVAFNPPPNWTLFGGRHNVARFNEDYLSFTLGDRFIVFVPSNDAITANPEKLPIPDEDVEYTDEEREAIIQDLQERIKYHYVHVSSSNLLDYPFPGYFGAGREIPLATFKFIEGSHDTVYGLTLIDNGTGLQVKDRKGNIYNVTTLGEDHGLFFPNVYNDGAVYQIDGILEFE